MFASVIATNYLSKSNKIFVLLESTPCLIVVANIIEIFSGKQAGIPFSVPHL